MAILEISVASQYDRRHSNMAAVGFSFPKIDSRSSPIFQMSGKNLRPYHQCKLLQSLDKITHLCYKWFTTTGVRRFKFNDIRDKIDGENWSSYLV